jgi:hypothetical protein
MRILGGGGGGGGDGVEGPETKKQIEQEPSTDFVSYRLGRGTGCPLPSVSLIDLQSYFESIYDRHSNPQGPQVLIFSISTNLKWKCTRI